MWQRDSFWGQITSQWRDGISIVVWALGGCFHPSCAGQVFFTAVLVEEWNMGSEAYSTARWGLQENLQGAGIHDLRGLGFDIFLKSELHLCSCIVMLTFMLLFDSCFFFLIMY